MQLRNIFAAAYGDAAGIPGRTGEATDYFGVRNCRDANHSRVGNVLPGGTGAPSRRSPKVRAAGRPGGEKYHLK